MVVEEEEGKRKKAPVAIGASGQNFVTQVNRRWPPSHRVRTTHTPASGPTRVWKEVKALPEKMTMLVYVWSI